MYQKYLKFGLKLLIACGLLSLGVFAQGNLGGVRWNLTQINTKKVSGSKAYLEISQNRLAGNAGCNRMFGSAEIAGGNIRFSRIGTTRMFCAERGAMKLETDFTQALQQVTRFRRSGSNLTFYAGSRVVLKFKAATKTDSDNNSSVNLEDKKWVLEEIKSASLPKIPEPAFINFDKAKSSAGGNTSCNVFGGNYSVTGEKFSFSQGISTMRACIEDARMTVERSFLDALREANRYEIKGGRLYLYKDRTRLLTFRAENK